MALTVENSLHETWTGLFGLGQRPARLAGAVNSTPAARGPEAPDRSLNLWLESLRELLLARNDTEH